MSNSTIEAIQTWSTPFFVAQLEDHEFLKDALILHIQETKARQQDSIDSQVAITAKHQLFESKLDYLEAVHPETMELRRLFEELVVAVATDVNHEYWPKDTEAEANIIESWYHITQNGGYHDVHSHPNCSWCGIYYLEPGDADFDQKNGINRFYDPRINAAHYTDAGSAYLGNQGVWDFSPIEGQVVIFPSYLKHSALPYFGSKDRVVIAFNCVVDIY